MTVARRLLFGDVETFSDVPIKNGTNRYSERAELMLYGYALDDGPEQVWDRTTGEPIPQDLADAHEDPDTLFLYHNSRFDRTVMGLTDFAMLHTVPPRERWRCMMAQALAHSLPGKLETLGEVFGLSEDEKKMKDGKALIQLFCKPRPKNMKLRRATRETHPEEWSRFVEYTRRDVGSMRTIYRKLPNWNYGGQSEVSQRETRLWFLDQRSNDRGFAVDLELAHGCMRAAGSAQLQLAEQTQDLTSGEVQAATQRDKLLEFVLRVHGIHLPDMKADTLERRLDDPELPTVVKELLRVRLSSSKTTATKYARLVQCTSSDGRLRGTTQYCGAGRTGRWSGRMFQPQNLKSRGLPPKDEIDAFIDAVKGGYEGLLWAA